MLLNEITFSFQVRFLWYNDIYVQLSKITPFWVHGVLTSLSTSQPTIIDISNIAFTATIDNDMMLANERGILKREYKILNNEIVRILNIKQSLTKLKRKRRIWWPNGNQVHPRQQYFIVQFARLFYQRRKVNGWTTDRLTDIRTKLSKC